MTTSAAYIGQYVRQSTARTTRAARSWSMALRVQRCTYHVFEGIQHVGGRSGQDNCTEGSIVKINVESVRTSVSYIYFMKTDEQSECGTLSMRD